MFELSRGQQIALIGVAVPTAAALLYLLLRKDDDVNEEKNESIVTSRQTVIEVKVPRNVVGSVIGRQGSNIKKIQEETGARVNFQDEAVGDEESICVIYGTQMSASRAEMLIRKLIVDQPVIEESHISVPQSAVGRIIGRNGDTIRELCYASHAKIRVPRESHRDQDVLISIKGTIAQIEIAKGLIEEKLMEEEAFRAKAALVASNRQERGKQKTSQDHKQEAKPKGTGDISQKTHVCETASVPSNKTFFEVYISAVDTAGHFWVQILRSTAIQLDKVVEEMTLYYDGQEDDSNKVLSVKVGDLVASQFEHDNSWYRARVIKVLEQGQVDMYYVDYGDNGIVSIDQIRMLRPDFLSLPLQAVECYLANVEPIGGNWSDESCGLFEELSHAAKWKVLMAKTVSYKQTEGITIPCLELVDTNGEMDVNINEELVKQGHAVSNNETSF